MNKKVVKVGGGIVIIVVILLVLLNGHDDTCSDDVRGYDRDVSSTISTLREAFNSIKVRLRVQERLNVPPLDGLTARTHTALRGIDTQCKLLRQCLRFVYFSPPSEACPTEYTDYRETRDTALTLLKKIERIQPAAQSAVQKAVRLHGARKDVESLEDTSSSTGGRLAVLQARARQLEGSLSQSLEAISSQIDGVISNSTKRTDQ